MYTEGYIRQNMNHFTYKMRYRTTVTESLK